ncbi:Het domain-containing protein [Lasiodiplodia theobromae]|uniref:Het domain-containing protein n=1 Tax=Lasiodiplodia theobromae TaxID=45133 RepID=UPI0015C38D8A|nr:Het domain-containing protein [Lasiodiplodia theobromae]KAF4545434.1 Het domain-containing protein [Lasiodiplodia theobromae]
MRDPHPLLQIIDGMGRTDALGLRRTGRLTRAQPPPDHPPHAAKHRPQPCSNQAPAPFPSLATLTPYVSCPTISMADRQPGGLLARTQSGRVCKLCNNLDPRSHPATFHDQESTSRSVARLSLRVDPVRLKRSEEKCPRCRLVAHTLDAHVEGWRKTKPRLLLDLVECAPLRLEVRPDIGSHCWGGGPTFITTTANLAERKRHIDFSSLPQSFQDAVVITQALGIHYLWIDALCIIQDSTADWEVESAQMSAIYENAHLTVAATAAPNSDAGIFAARPRPAKLSYRASARAKKAHKLCARKIPDHHLSSPASSSSSSSSTLPIFPPPTDPHHHHYQPQLPLSTHYHPPPAPAGPLRHRAWALQEHVLCSRILHYTAHELLFECRIASRCECHHNLLLPHQHTTKPSPTTPGLLPRLLTTGRRAQHRRTWHAIVAAYTARELSFPADKLPAISGIARGLLAVRGSGSGSGGGGGAAGRGAGASEYVAGLWREGLVGDLLWAAASSSGMAMGVTARPVPKVWRAPSWSWASVEGEVGYAWVEGGSAGQRGEGVGGGGGVGGVVGDEEGEEEFVSLVRVEEAVARPAGRNPLGAVREAWIVLVGPVLGGGGGGGGDNGGGGGAGVAVKLVVKVDDGDEDEGRKKMRYFLKRAHGEGGGVVEMVPDSLLLPVTGLDSSGGSSVRRAKVGDENEGEEVGVAGFEANVLCLGMARCEGSWIAGLVLVPSSSSSSPPSKGGNRGRGNGKSVVDGGRCYERVGTFSCGDEWFAGAEKRELVLV